MYPDCSRLVQQKLIELGFDCDANRIGKDKNYAFSMSHENGSVVKIPFSVLESMPELEQKVSKVLAYYIGQIQVANF